MLIPSRRRRNNITSAKLMQSVYFTGDGTASRKITTGIDMADKGGMLWHAFATRTSGTEDKYCFPTPVIRSTINLAAGEVSVSTFTGNYDVDGHNIKSPLNGSANTYRQYAFKREPKFMDYVEYTGNDVTGRVVPHALGVVPKAIMIFNKGNTNAPVAIYLAASIKDNLPGIAHFSNYASTAYNGGGGHAAGFGCGGSSCATGSGGNGKYGGGGGGGSNVSGSGNTTRNGGAGGQGVVFLSYNGKAVLIKSSNAAYAPADLTTSTQVKMWVVGAGGGGGYGSTKGCGGGAGGVAYKLLTMNPGDTLDVSIGASGTGGSAGVPIGGTGGTTTVTFGGVTYTANGGVGGTTNTPNTAGVGGTASNGDFNYTGGNGAAYVGSTAAISGGGGGLNGGNAYSGNINYNMGTGSPANDMQGLYALLPDIEYKYIGVIVTTNNSGLSSYLYTPSFSSNNEWYEEDVTTTDFKLPRYVMSELVNGGSETYRAVLLGGKYVKTGMYKGTVPISVPVPSLNQIKFLLLKSYNVNTYVFDEVRNPANPRTHAANFGTNAAEVDFSASGGVTLNVGGFVVNTSAINQNIPVLYLAIGKD